MPSVPTARFSFVTLLRLAALSFFLMVSSLAWAAAELRTGVWYGNVGGHPVILCVEPGQAAYYYPGQSSDISLQVDGGRWVEKAGGQVTGRWNVNPLNNNPNQLDGEWRNARRKSAQPFTLNYLANVPAACGSSAYQQALLLPNEARLKLPMPKPGQVSALGKNVAVVRQNGELWGWDEDHPQPKLLGKDYVQAAAGTSHTVAIRADGSLWGWGSNRAEQLGGEGEGDQPVPMGEGFVAVAANGNYSLAVKSDGTLWSWGGVEHGKFDDGAGNRKSKPSLIGKSFVSVSAGDAHFAAIKSDGTLWTWGRDSDGQLGLGSTGSWLDLQYGYEIIPAQVGKDFAAVSGGYAHSAALRKDGSLWAWGHAPETLGNGSTDGKSSMPLNIGSGYAQAVAGFVDTAAVKKDGSLWLWGGGKPGFSDCTTPARTRPVQIGAGYMQVALGSDFLIAMKSDGSVWTLGWLWDGDQMDVPRACRKLAQVVFGDGVNAWDKPVASTARMTLAQPAMPDAIASIAAGESHSAMVRADGTLWTWGSNEVGQLATGTYQNRNLPQQAGTGYAEVSTDGDFTLLKKQDGSLQRWGISLEFMDTKMRQPAPAAAKVFPGTVRLFRSSSDLMRGLGLRNDGAVLDWQYQWKTSEKPVDFGRDVTGIAAGRFRSYAVKKDGTLWELSQYPVKPPPKLIGRDYVHVASSADSVFGIKTDGSLWAWGANSMRELGDGTTVERPQPVKIGSGFVQVAAGRFHGIALAADGSVWTWGDNETGVIGDGTNTARSRPVRIGTGFARIAAGAYHNLALKQDGTLWAWGNNEDGQLGDGTNERRLAPLQVYPQSANRQAAAPAPAQAPLKQAVISVQSGLTHNCATYRDGAMKCWGSNAEGQLGNDRYLAQNPVPLVVEDREYVLRKLKEFEGNMLACTGAQAKQCRKVEGRFPFLRGAATIVDGSMVCGLMKNGTIRCRHRELSATEHVIDGIHGALMFNYVGDHGCALQADGRVKCWGNNSNGQLGNGTLVTPYSSREFATEVVGL